MKLWCSLLIVSLILPMIITATNADVEQREDGDKTSLKRITRGSKNRAAGGGNGSPPCRYTKGQWSECDPKTNMRTRTLTLKKGEKTCEQTKTITKKCKKGKRSACRYEKGSWSSCVDGNMTRIDSLKPKSDFTCEKTRRMNKSCKPEANGKKATKDRSNKKSGKQQ